MDVINKVTEILTNMIKDKGIEIIDLMYKKESGKMVLRVLLDKEEGITLDDCTEINNQLSEILDSKNVIDEPYILEISSPGLDRPMKERRDFERALGKNIRVSTYVPIEGNNLFKGKLLGLNKSSIVIEDKKGITTEIPNEKIAKATFEIEFE